MSIKTLLRLLAATLLLLSLSFAHAQNAPAIGIVIMHGKGGMPGGLTTPLADGLQAKGWLVANLQMPWSRDRKYDVDVSTAVKEVSAAIQTLRSKAAQKIFVAGHSQGAVFGIYFAGQQPVDGLIVIAPGGNVGAAFYQQQVGAAVSRARCLVEDAKGGEAGDFDEFEGGKSWTIRTSAAIYLSWFDADGAMNQMKSSAALPKTLPVLHVAPTSDYPALLRAKRDMFRALPDHPQRRLYEPDSDHRNAPRDSIEEIARWVGTVTVP